MDGVAFCDNLIEDCTYSVEYFLGKAERADADRQMKNILISGCVMRRAGYGWGIQRPDRETLAHLKSWDHGNRRSGPFTVEDNIFDRSRHMMLHTAAEKAQWLPVLQKNEFIQYEGASFGRFGAAPTAMRKYEDAGIPAEIAETNAFRTVRESAGREKA